MNENIVLKNKLGKTKIIYLKNDIVLLLLSIIGFGWIKLFIDGRISSGVINALLFYTFLGALIHGIYLAVKPEKHIIELLKKGYNPATTEDEEKIEKYLNIKF